MAAPPEALAVWAKALRKLEEASATPAQTFPGIVVVSSHAAMRNAAIAVLLVLGKTAPAAETALVRDFGTAIGPQAQQHGAAFNRAFDLKNAEDYDPIDSPTVDDAEGVRRDAYALIMYCSSKYVLPSPDASGGMPK